MYTFLARTPQRAGWNQSRLSVRSGERDRERGGGGGSGGVSGGTGASLVQSLGGKEAVMNQVRGARVRYTGVGKLLGARQPGRRPSYDSVAGELGVCAGGDSFSDADGHALFTDICSVFGRAARASRASLTLSLSIEDSSFVNLCLFVSFIHSVQQCGAKKPKSQKAKRAKAPKCEPKEPMHQ